LVKTFDAKSQQEGNSMNNNTQKKSLISQGLVFTLFITLIVFISACSGSNLTQEDQKSFQDAVNTAVAGTVTAQALDAQRTKGAEAALSPSETSAPTNTTAPNTPTPEPTQTPKAETTEETPEEEGQPESSSLSGPSVQVSIDTNCRSGPGKSYTWLGALMVGEEAVITGKDPQGLYWYIQNPNQEGNYCWIWGFYATISGNTAPLPIYTPGPTPTPDPNFSTDFHQVESCAGAWQVEFTVVNNGLVNLESISSSVKDTVTGNSSGKSSKNFFTEKNGCADVSSYDRLKPEKIGYTVSLDLPSDPTGHLVYASLTVCTEDNLYGDCRTREFYFTP
jgi:uncharacterized protein YgiM (DUF1202 family)